jgi:hypothetical protein
MRRPGFYFVCDDPDPTKSKGQQRITEREGFICSHCGKAVWVEPLADPADFGGRCTICSDNRDPLKGLVCKPCRLKGKCMPFEEQLARVEARKMLFTQIR